MEKFYKYNNYLLKENKRDSSIYLYIYYLRKFLKWYEENTEKTFSRLEKSAVDMYLESVSSKVSKTSINSYINFFKSYNSFLISEGIQENMVVDNSMRRRTSKKKSDKVNDVDEKYIEAILQNICLSDGIKNYTMLNLIANSGLRALEVKELRLEDLDFDNRVINITGAYERKIPMNSNVENSLKLYLKEIYVMEEYLFINERGTKYTEAGIRWIFRKNCSDTDITIATLRNFYKIKLKNQGYSNKEIDKVLGYKTNGKKYSDRALKDMLTPSQFSKIFNVAPITVIKWCNKGIVKAYRTDKGFRKIPNSEVERLKKLRLKHNS
ncbi:tyrosine-type recombinase/integrase [Clostridium sp. PL3]|uniref:Tyrosine-type recombinase/integrase n=1 Tax=Clostridium thailandense TaxID=2794346 RepID=A0A949X4C8_9CLOT|nr:tyrosine-type recombinase/integrase [Clostridium thailandense]MBV7276244.1 tyrosine-type recombinase/integrase [Clostridium thailandense]